MGLTWRISPKYTGLLSIFKITDFANIFPLIVVNPKKWSLCRKLSNEYFPVANSSNAILINLDLNGLGSIFRVTGLFTYPSGAVVAHSPLRTFWRSYSL